MPAVRYRGFDIVARPYRLFESGRWTADLVIRRKGHGRRFEVPIRYGSEREAADRGTLFGRQIIDGKVHGSSVEDLGVHARRRHDRRASHRGDAMLRRVSLGVISLLAGLAVLVIGPRLASPLEPSRGTIASSPWSWPPTLPQWIGGGALLLGAAFLAAGARRHA